MPPGNYTFSPKDHNLLGFGAVLLDVVYKPLRIMQKIIRNHDRAPQGVLPKII